MVLLESTTQSGVLKHQFRAPAASRHFLIDNDELRSRNSISETDPKRDRQFGNAKDDLGNNFAGIIKRGQARQRFQVAKTTRWEQNSN